MTAPRSITRALARSAAAALGLVAAACSGSSSAPAPSTPGTDPGPGSAGAFFEPAPTQPLAVSADGLRLYAVQPSGGTLAVFSLADPAAPVLLGEVRVGLGPVAVAERVGGEVWVANQLSDSVSVVDVESLRVLDTLAVGDQPSDVVFAGGRAFVTLATEDRVAVLDGATRAPVASIDVPGEEPRALAVGDGGQSVWVLVRRSGNGTTILPSADAPAPPPPQNPALPPAPQTGLVVRADDPDWADALSYTLPDEDLFRIDVAALVVAGSVRAIGTTLFDVAVDPSSSALWVVGTEARNLIAFEPELRGRAVEHRVVAVDGAALAVDTILDLNPDIETEILPDPDSLAVALAEPTGLAFDAVLRRLYVAAQGTDRVAVVDVDGGGVLERLELGAPGDTTVDRRGPRALALHPTAGLLYVYNGLSDTVSVVDPAAGGVVREFPAATHDPVPADVRAGRKFLFDARLSGNGTLSCASCHVDAETDGVAWDLGDPAGALFEVPPELQQGPEPGVAPDWFPPLHPMKGPLVTQSLRGLGEPLHWRGDRLAFEDFNGAFDSLMGGPPLDEGDLALFATWADSVRHPPNPHQPLDRSLAAEPPDASPLLGSELFHDAPTGTLACVECHAGPETTNHHVARLEDLSSQPMRVAPLLDYYRKDGFDPDATSGLTVGFGRFSDGHVGDLVELADDSVLFEAATGGSPHVDAFLRQLDTGTPPITGVQARLDVAVASDPDLAALRALLRERAALGEIDLVAHGTAPGAWRALLYEPESDAWRPDRAGVAPLANDALEAAAFAGDAALVLTAVPPGTGAGASIDVDGDGELDGDVAAAPFGAPSPAGCAGAPTLDASALPRVGESQFAVVVRDVAPDSQGALLIGDAVGSAPLGALEILVAADPQPTTLGLEADPLGVAVAPLPIPDDPALAGTVMTFQALWPAPCVGGQATSAGLALTIAP